MVAYVNDDKSAKEEFSMISGNNKFSFRLVIARQNF